MPHFDPCGFDTWICQRCAIVKSSQHHTPQKCEGFKGNVCSDCVAIVSDLDAEGFDEEDSNVADYFLHHFHKGGFFIDLERKIAVEEFPLDSSCGEDCQRLIDSVNSIIIECRPSNDFKRQLIVHTWHTVCIYCFG
jgi:hypothetical protein